MLVLSRKVGERIVIAEDIVVVVKRIVGTRVTLAIEAPTDIKVLRGELKPFPPKTVTSPEPQANMVA